MSELDDRLTQEVTQLSTKLMLAMARQLELEENTLHLNKEITQLKSNNEKLNQYESWYQTLMPKYAQTQEELRSTRELKRVAEAENSKLQGEVEDLTASLFDEANKMVSDALRETYNFKVKNRKLFEEIEEKNTIINDLQEQLKDLKELFFRIEVQQKQQQTIAETPKTEKENAFESLSTTISNKTTDPLEGSVENADQYQKIKIHTIIYSPNVDSIRLDLNNYNQDFKAFVYALIKPEFHFDLASLKNLQYFKKIWSEDLENAIPSVPNLPHNSSLMNRWLKGKHFWNSVVEGRAIIEPVKGINEVFKLSYHGADRAPGNIPVAIKDPCSFCGEVRNDVLEHSRLYYLKLLHDKTTNAHANAGSPAPGDDDHSDILASYPLCNYCLIKLRNVCEFFAKLRLIHANIYKLKHDSSFDEFANVTTTISQFKRNSSTLGFNSASSTNLTNSPVPPMISESDRRSSTQFNSVVPAKNIDGAEESKLIKIYIMLILIRNKIFWSKIGFWDSDDSVTEVNLDEIKNETFLRLVSGANASSPATPVIPPTPVADSESVKVQAENEEIKGENVKNEGIEGKSVKNEEIKDDIKTENIKDDSKIERDEIIHPKQRNGVKRDEEDSDEFADTSETFQTEQEPTEEPIETKIHLESEEAEILAPEDTKKLGRKNSKSKKFTEKINNDLDETLAMLKQSIQE